MEIATLLSQHHKVTAVDIIPEKVELIGPNVCIYDHDHNYKGTGYLSGEIFIGKNVWIGANAVILRGTRLGDGCVVGADTVVKGIFDEDMLITQNRETKTKCIAKEV